jgi:putative ABC transport system permease protein
MHLRGIAKREQMKQAYRERRGFTLFATTAQDIRYAVRVIRKNRGFTITSIAVLALAIGANTAMFSVLNAVLLRPLPYSSPEQLAMLWSEVSNQNLRQGRSAYWNVEQWRSQSQSFADMAVFDGASGTLTTADSTEKISIARISPNLFALLGVRPLLGRTFSAKEADQSQRLVLISYGFWQTRFRGSRAAIGASIDLDGIASRVIGVVPATFPTFLADADVWEPYTLSPNWAAVRRARGSGFWAVIARLRPNVTFEQAQSEMNVIAGRLDEQLPASERGRGISVVPLKLQVTGPKARLALWMLTGAVFCVLLIAATNVASLSLTRSAKREREIAIRAALGASRARIVSQLLAENLTLAVISGLLGLFVAQVCIQLILTVKPGNLARLNEVGLDTHVLGWALALCLFTGVLVGFAPAITMARRNLTRSSQEEARGVSGRVAAQGIRHILVVAQFALAIILLAGAGLLIRSLLSVQNVDPGFRPERVLSAQLATSASMSTGQRAIFYDRVLEQIESLPGVESAGITENFLISSNPERMLTTEARAGTVSAHLRLRSDAVSGRFFKTVGTRLLRGRLFSAQDRPDSPRVAIINEAMARRLWPGRDPVGKRFKMGEIDPGWITVVGVVGDMRRQGLENEPIPQMFEPMAQDPSRLATLLVRTSTDDPLGIVGSVRAAVRRVEKYVPVYGVTTLANQVGAFLTERRFQTWLLAAFSAIAVLMSAVGIYGLIHYSVATRTQEIGIRMAVGAHSGQILRMVIGEGLKLSLGGLGLGLIGALYVAEAGRSLIFGVRATDPWTFAAVSLLLVAVAIAACYFPARRAAKVEPLTSLRQE